jgi:hypothetical protein
MNLKKRWENIFHENPIVHQAGLRAVSRSDALTQWAALTMQRSLNVHEAALLSAAGRLNFTESR